MHLRSLIPPLAMTTLTCALSAPISAMDVLSIDITVTIRKDILFLCTTESA